MEFLTPEIESNFLEWNAIIVLSSLERCCIFYGNMELPDLICHSPNHLLEISKDYLKRESEVKDCGNEFSKIRANRLRDFFYRLETYYGSNTVSDFYTWCLRYEVNRQSENNLFRWGIILSDIWNVDEFQPPQFISFEIQSKIIDIFDERSYRDLSSTIEKRIEIAKLANKTEWENWLDSKHRLSIGDDWDFISPVESSLTMVELIVDNCYTWNVLNRLRNQLSNSEKEVFSNWVNIQSEIVFGPNNSLSLDVF